MRQFLQLLSYFTPAIAYLSAVCGVPFVSTVGPGEGGGEGGEEETETPRQNHVVEEIDVESNADHLEPDPCTVTTTTPGDGRGGQVAARRRRERKERFVVRFTV